ncbi:MAG: hypothetical protein IPJ32_05810 [Sphingobacteriaceae bacterium]|nr:hypothetical protein [Sphingobacteriaceae bacterium]
MGKKFITWLICGAFISITFVAYSFSYWGDKGLGDFARIPIGNDYEIGNIDGASTYIENSNRNGKQAFINKFILAGDKICAEFQGFNSTDCENCYIVFDVNKAEFHELHSSGRIQSLRRKE